MDERNYNSAPRDGGEGERRQPPRRPRRKKKRLTAFGVLLYVAFVIGVSALLATLGWVWANDVLARRRGSLR